MDSSEFRVIMRIFVLIVFLSSIYMIWPFIDALAFSCAFAYMAKPIYDRLKPYLGRSISALTCLLVFTIPTIIVGLMVLKSLLLFLQDLDIGKLVNDVFQLASYFGIQDIAKENINPILSQTWEFLKPTINSMLNQISLLPQIIIKITMIFFMTYYFLKDGYRLKNVIIPNIPQEYRQKTIMFLNNLNESYKHLFIGNAFTSIVIGIISGIGYYLIGVPNAFILAVVTGIFALLPIVGGWTVYMPFSIYFLITGEVLKAIELFIFGVIFLSATPDFIIRPMVVKKESDVHPVLILIAFLIGPLTLGLGGFALGPLIVGALDAVSKVKRYENNTKVELSNK